MMHPDMDKLLELQRHDDTIGEFHRERVDLPTRIAAIDQELAADERALRELEEEVARLDRERRQIEADIAEAADKIQKTRTRVSEVHNTREYNAVLKELSSAEKRNREREEAVIEIMEETELLRQQRAEREQIHGQKRHDLGEERSELARALKALDGRLSKARAERDEISKHIDTRILRQYDFMAGRGMTPVVSLINDKHCAKCHLSIPPRIFNSLIAGDQVQQCPSCRRILYLDNSVIEAAQAAAVEAKAKAEADRRALDEAIAASKAREDEAAADDEKAAER
ncbi:MAG: hypothetical protein KC466_18655 [Myxococcales bacterium]|nr:hypothetical protein [Myxococcales bacterium]